MNAIVSIIGTLLGVVTGSTITYLYNRKMWVRQSHLTLDIAVVSRVEAIIQQLISAEAKGRTLAGSGDEAIKNANELGAIWNPAQAAFKAAAGTLRERFDTCSVRNSLAKFETAINQARNSEISSADFMDAAAELQSILQMEVFHHIN